jgi:hypothetical protein
MGTSAASACSSYPVSDSSLGDESIPAVETCWTDDQPEKRLVRTVLEDALHIVVNGQRGVGGRTVIVETEAWFASDDIEWPYSFRNVCDFLDVDPDRIRAWLARQGASARAARRATFAARASLPVRRECPLPASALAAAEGGAIAEGEVASSTIRLDVERWRRTFGGDTRSEAFSFLAT